MRRYSMKMGNDSILIRKIHLRDSLYELRYKWMDVELLQLLVLLVMWVATRRSDTIDMNLRSSDGIRIKTWVKLIQ